MSDGHVTFTTDLPDAEGLVMDASVQSELTAEWDPVLNNGEYRLEYRDDDPDGDHPDYQLVATVDYDDVLERTIDNLVDGEQYSIRLRTETDHVTGEWLEASPITKLVAPSGVEVIQVGTSETIVGWTNESDFRGSNQIYRRRTDYDYGGNMGRLVGTVAEDDEEFVDESAQPNREYEYTVRALTQWVYADSDSSDPATADGIGLETRSVPSDKPYIEIDHPNRAAPLTPEVEAIQRQPTINGYPRLSITTPPDERWLDEDLDDADLRAWIDGERQPIDVLEHRTLSPESTEFEARGGTQLDRRVVATADIEPALEFAKDLIGEYTDLDVVLDEDDGQIREEVLLVLAETLAELQGSFREIPDDVPAEWAGDQLRPSQVGWASSAPSLDSTNSSGIESDDEFVDGDALVFDEIGGQGTLEFDLEYEVELSNLEVVIRGDDRGTGDMIFEVSIAGETITDTGIFPDDNEWSTYSTSGATIGPGSYEAQIEVISGSADGDGFMFDAMCVYDSRYSEIVEDEEVHEPSGHLEHPPLYPVRESPARLVLEEVATPLSIVRVLLEAVSDDGDPLPELSIGVDGSDDEWDTVTETLSHDLEYEELAAVASARVGLGHRDDLEPRNDTPRVAYEPQALDAIELRADLDETPVVVNYQRDAQLMDHLRDIVGDVADAAFEVQPGGVVHIARIDGRETDIDPDLVDYSIERNTEDTADRAIVYAGAESLRRIPVGGAEVDEWTELPLGEGRIVRDSETVYDAAEDDETLERGEDYEIRPVVVDGPPEIKLLTDVDELRIDCDFKPRGEHEAADLPDEPSEIVEEAPNLSSQQMADIAAFQAVEGSYTDAIIDASISVPVDQIGWNVLDALNVADLPVDQPYQIKDGDSDPANGDYRLGAGRTGQEEIQQLNNETGRLSERV